MSVTTLASASAYTAAISSPGLTVVHFMAPWAEECKGMAQVINTLAQQHQDGVSFTELPAEDFPEESLKAEIVAVPTVLLYRAGKAVGRVDGFKAAELTKLVQSLASAPASKPPAQSAKPSEDLDTRLGRLVKAHKCMLFMKGKPEEPKCGFSKQTIALLDSLEVEYGSFDIFGDDEVRQGLKKFSNWPTYPQLYLDGELVGGLDILKELAEAGELKGMLPSKQQLEDRLKQIINKAPVVVFMKGDPSQPKCGFSNTLMGILKETDIQFQTFDILSDEDVRQGLKKFSNWPTYPQVYVKGELIGGLDIIKELKEAGELEASLRGEA